MAPSAVEVFPQILVSQLGAQKYSLRQQAEENLIALRELALTSVLNAQCSKDIEISLRAKRIGDEIERRVAWQISTVTWKSKPIPASEIYSELSKRTNVKIAFVPTNESSHDPLISVNFVKTPLWQALNSVSEKSGHSLNADSIRGTGPSFMPLVLSGARDKTRVSCFESACAILPSRLPLAYQGLSEQKNDPSTLRLPLVVFLDSRALSSAIFVPRVRCRAWTDDGAYLSQYRGPFIEPPTRVDFMNPNYAASTNVYELSPQIFAPLRSTKKISRLELDVTLFAVTRLKTFEISELNHPEIRSFGMNKLTLSPPLTNERGESLISLVMKGPEDFLDTSPSLVLNDPNGSIFSLHKDTPRQLAANQVEHVFMFRKWSTQRVSSASVTFPVKVTSKEFKFEFTDLELPEALWQGK